MKNIDELIEFLTYGAHDRKNLIEKPLTSIKICRFDENVNSIPNRVAKDETFLNLANTNVYRNITNKANDYDNKVLYVLKGNTASQNKYYFRFPNTNYFIDVSKKEVAHLIFTTERINKLTTITLQTGVPDGIKYRNEDVYYNINENICYVTDKSDLPMPVVISYKPYFPFNPAYTPLEDATYTMKFMDSYGSENGWLDYTPNWQVQLKVNRPLREGNIFLFPKLEGLTLRYCYRDDDTPIKTVGLDTAFTLSFNRAGSMLVFLTRSIFDQLSDDARLTDTKDIVKGDFFKDLLNFVNERLKTFASNYDEKLSLLFYIPPILFREIKAVDLWEVLRTMLGRSIHNVGRNDEDIVINILQGIAKKEDPTSILTKLYTYKLEIDMAKLKPGRKSGNKADIIQAPYYYLLFKALDTYHFDKYMYLIYQLWRASDYSKNMATPGYHADTMHMLPYKSEKFFGLYFSNWDLDFAPNQEIRAQKDSQSVLGTTVESVATAINPLAGLYKALSSSKSEKDTYYYHPYQPIMVADTEQETALQMPPIMPALFLMAVEEKKFWSNVSTTIQYAGDIISTFSGFGNIAKFRYFSKLGKVVDAADNLKKVGKLMQGFRLFTGTVEITSGVLNVLLKLTGLQDTPFGKALSEYLFYLELVSLGGEVTVALTKRLKAAGKALATHEKEILEHVDGLLKKGEIDEVAKSELLEHLDEVAELSRNSGKFTVNNDGVISVGKFNKIAKRIKEEFGIDMFLIDRNNETWKTLYNEWYQKPLYGMFAPSKLRSKNYPKVILDGPALYLFKGASSKGIFEVTSYTVQHELYHLQMFQKLKEKFPYNYQKVFNAIPDEIHETYVLSEFVKARKYTKTWDEANILQDLDWFNDNFKKNKNLMDFEIFDLNNYLKNIEL